MNHGVDELDFPAAHPDELLEYPWLERSSDDDDGGSSDSDSDGDADDFDDSLYEDEEDEGSEDSEDDDDGSSSEEEDPWGTGEGVDDQRRQDELDAEDRQMLGQGAGGGGAGVGHVGAACIRWQPARLVHGDECRLYEARVAHNLAHLQAEVTRASKQLQLLRCWSVDALCVLASVVKLKLKQWLVRAKFDPPYNSGGYFV